MARSAVASSRFVGLPTGTIVFCLRRRGVLGARLPSGQSCELRLNAFDRLVPNGSRPEIYGLSLEKGSDALWISDKRTSRLTRVQLGYNPNDSTLELVSILTALKDDHVKCPCMIDSHPEYGLLAAAFGTVDSPADAGVYRFDGKEWEQLTAPGVGSVTHCCWLGNGGFAYITRRDSILWWVNRLGQRPEALTRPNGSKLPAQQGSLSDLRLRYVQGMTWVQKRGELLVADASLGCIFRIMLQSRLYNVLVGRPTETDSGFRANVHAGDPNVCLGPVRAMAEDLDGNVVWLDGDSGKLFKFSNGQISELGIISSDGRTRHFAGCGMHVLGVQNW